MSTNVQSFISDLDAGIFEEKLSRILSDVAGAVIDNKGAGKVTLQFDITQIGDTYQVAIKHKLAYTRPTMHGKASEEDIKVTPMHVGTNGALSFFPEDQTQMFDKRGKVQEGVE